jgi:hypothetical protein
VRDQAQTFRSTQLMVKHSKKSPLLYNKIFLIALVVLLSACGATQAKQLGEKCQFDFADELSSHSFRRGMSTSSAREKIYFALIKKQGGWKNYATVWGYIEEAQSLSENATLQLMEKMIVLLNQQTV